PAAAGEAPGLLYRGGIVAGRRDVGELGGHRQVGLLRTRERCQRIGWPALDETIGGEPDYRGLLAAVGEYDAALALARIDEEGELERLQRLVRRQHAVDDEAGEHAVKTARVIGGEAVVVEDRRHRRAERRTGMPAGDPVAEAPVLGIAPGLAVGRKGRVGP